MRCNCWLRTHKAAHMQEDKYISLPHGFTVCEHSDFPAFLFPLMSMVLLGSPLTYSFLFHLSMAMGQLVQKTTETELPKSKAFLKEQNWKKKKIARFLHECFKAVWFLISFSLANFSKVASHARVSFLIGRISAQQALQILNEMCELSERNQMNRVCNISVKLIFLALLHQGMNGIK